MKSFTYTHINICLYKEKKQIANTSDCFVLIWALRWGKQIVQMSGSGPGYMQTIKATPYMHILIYHVPCML